jgi:DnaK suppressor protein
MDNEQKNKLMDVINKEIEGLNISIDRLKQTVQPVAPDDAIGRLTRMDAINSKSINEATLRSAEIKFGKLKKALENIDDPGFGICTSCEEPIPFGRLMVMPESRMCVKCIDGKV